MIGIFNGSGSRTPLPSGGVGGGFPSVGQRNRDAGVQIGQFAHTLGDDVVFVFRRREDGRVGPELLARARLVGVAHDFHIVERLSLFVFLLIDVAVAIDLRHHPRRQRIDARNAHAVQAARHLVGAFVELTARVQHRHHDLEGRLVHLLVLIDG